MPAHVIVGTQWGDEGKGRVVDWFAAQSDIVARYGGGDNAGHSIHVGGEIFKLHLVPSGITYPDTICVMGNGMVVNPHTLARELRELAARGVDISPGRVLLSDAAHLILPTHIALDRAMEARRGGRAIGTTSRGIGPAYTDKAARAGLRAALLRHPGELARQARARIEQHNRVLEGAYEAQPVDAEQAIEALGEVAAFLAPTSATRRSICTRRLLRARLCCARARRRRCSTSTTAIIRTSPARRPRWAGRSPGWASARSTWRG